MYDQSLLKNLRILVVGDVMVDAYVCGKGRRLSPEAPVPVVLVDNKEFKLGGACNVVANLAQMECEIDLCGIVGLDNTAGICRELLAGTNMSGVYLVECDKPTILKTRIICDNQHVVRFDEESQFQAEHVELLKEKIAQLPDYDAIIISDYAKGTINQELIRFVKSRFEDTLIMVDPKPHRVAIYKGVSAVTPNFDEARQMAGYLEADPEECAKLLMAQLGCEFVIVTLSEQGVLLYSDDEMVRLPARSISMTDVARPQGVDVTGAGDTLISFFTAYRCMGLSLSESVFVANVAAAIVVNKIGTDICTMDELERELKNG